MEASNRYSLEGKHVVVVGGTGNVGSFVVRSLLAHGAAVAVPSRSEQKIENLRSMLPETSGSSVEHRLHTFLGNVSDERDGKKIREAILNDLPRIDAVIASLGRLHTVPSLLSAAAADLNRVLQDYLFAHFQVAKTFLPHLKTTGGTYLFVNGPLAFDIWSDTDTSLVSIATAAQNMLFRGFADELEESPARVVELVNHAFIREWKTQPTSPIPGDTVGEYVSQLLAGTAAQRHGESLHLRSQDQVSAVA